MEFKGRQARREQQATAARLGAAAADLQLAEKRTEAVLERSQQVQAVLADLRLHLQARFSAFEVLVAQQDDYRTYSTKQKRFVAQLVSLATTIVTVMATPFVDDDGLVTDLSAKVMQDARSRLADFAAA